MKEQKVSSFARSIQHTYLGQYLITRDSRFLLAFAAGLLGFIFIVLAGFTGIAFNRDWLILGFDEPFAMVIIFTCLSMTGFTVSHLMARNLPLAIKYGMVSALLIALTIFKFSI